MEATCEDIAILNDGKVLYNGTVDNLLNTAQGKIFTKITDKKELPKLKKELTITSMHTQNEKIYIRFLSECAVHDAQVCEPNIEDAYMLYLSENGAYPSLSIDDLGGEL